MLARRRTKFVLLALVLARRLVLRSVLVQKERCFCKVVAILQRMVLSSECQKQLFKQATMQHVDTVQCVVLDYFWHQLCVAIVVAGWSWGSAIGGSTHFQLKKLLTIQLSNTKCTAGTCTWGLFKKDKESYLGTTTI